MKVILGILIIFFLIVYGAFYYDSQRRLETTTIEQKMQHAVHETNQKMAFPRQLGAFIRFEPWVIQYRVITMPVIVKTKDVNLPSDVKQMMKDQLMVMNCTMMNKATEKELTLIERLKYYIEFRFYNQNKTLLWGEKILLKHC